MCAVFSLSNGKADVPSCVSTRVPSGLKATPKIGIEGHPKDGPFVTQRATNGPACGHVPDLRLTPSFCSGLSASCYHALAIRTEGHGPNATAVGERFIVVLGAGHFPLADLRACREDYPAVAAKSHVPELVSVLEGLADNLARGRIPQPCRTILASREKPRAIGAEGYGINPSVMAKGISKGLGRGRIPDASDASACYDECLALGTEGCGDGIAFVVPKRLPDALPCCRIPEAGNFTSARYHGLEVRADGKTMA
jgi:hypothetical protein